MKKILTIFIILFVVGLSFDHFEKYCVCYDSKDCSHAVLSCNKIILSKDINNLRIMNKNIEIDCKGHNIGNLIFENSDGSIENCVFEDRYNCLEIKYNKNINLIIKNNKFSHCYNGIIIKSDQYGNISIENNTLSKNNYGLILYAPINKITNNTFKNFNRNIFIYPCEKNETICENIKKMDVEGNYFARYKDGNFVPEDLNNYIIKDKNPKKEDPTEQKKNLTTKKNKKNEENNNGFPYILIAIFIVLISIGGFVFLKYKKRNEDDFEW